MGQGAGSEQLVKPGFEATVCEPLHTPDIDYRINPPSMGMIVPVT